MIDDVHGGRPVFYDIYTEQQKAEDAAKANTGLFFFRGRPGAPFAVIAPGGGFCVRRHPSTKAFPMPSRFATGATTPSS